MAGLDAETCLTLMANLCERIPTAAEQITAQVMADGIAGASELAERLVPALERHCAHTLKRL